MTRVVFYTQGRHVPSSRFRVQQLVPQLEGHGISCTVLAPYPSVHGDVDWRWVHGHRRELLRPFSVVSRLGQLAQVRSHDLVYIQRPLVRYYTTLMERYVTHARPTVFELDDAIFHNFFGLERFKIRRIIDRVDRVVVGNQYLADFVGQPHKTSIIPTVVDAQRYSPRPDPAGPFTIGWTGLSSNLRELDGIIEVLRRVLAQTGGRLLIIADRCDASWARSIPVEFVRWSPTTEVEALARVHVGIMPLRDTPYNRGKCGFKLIQYMARAIPVVCSPLTANAEIVRDGVDGWHARSPEQWEDRLLAIWRDGEMRRRMAADGRARVEQRYSVDAVVPRYLEIFNSLVG